MESQNVLTEEELKEQHKEWIGNLSEGEFKRWQKNQAGFATRHFGEIEYMIDEALEQVRKNPHSLDNISHIGVVIQSLGEMTQEYDYLGVIKLSIGHEAETEILDKIASIVRTIREGTKLYYHTDFDQ